MSHKLFPGFTVAEIRSNSIESKTCIEIVERQMLPAGVQVRYKQPNYDSDGEILKQEAVESTLSKRSVR